LGNLSRSILALKGQPTSNLQVTLDETVKLGDRTSAVKDTNIGSIEKQASNLKIKPI